MPSAWARSSTTAGQADQLNLTVRWSARHDDRDHELLPAQAEPGRLGPDAVQALVDSADRPLLDDGRERGTLDRRLVVGHRVVDAGADLHHELGVGRVVTGRRGRGGVRRCRLLGPLTPAMSAKSWRSAGRTASDGLTVGADRGGGGRRQVLRRGVLARRVHPASRREGDRGSAANRPTRTSLMIKPSDARQSKRDYRAAGARRPTTGRPRRRPAPHRSAGQGHLRGRAGGVTTRNQKV